MLLSQQINFLGLTTLEKKIKVIKYFTYLKTLDALKYYLGLTGYLRNYIHFYAQLAAAIQALKIFFLRNTSIDN